MAWGYDSRFLAIVHRWQGWLVGWFGERWVLNCPPDGVIGSYGVLWW